MVARIAKERMVIESYVVRGDLRGGLERRDEE